jgi:ribonuclease J
MIKDLFNKITNNDNNEVKDDTSSKAQPSTQKVSPKAPKENSEQSTNEPVKPKQPNNQNFNHKARNSNQNNTNPNRANSNNPNNTNHNPNAKTLAGKKPIPTFGKGWHNDLHKSFEANENIQKQRLTPNIDIKNTNKITITPIGGLDEIGGNIMVIETEDSAVIVDGGMNFPDESGYGVDILIPDFTYLREVRHKIKAILITHAHEDHIGAMVYLFKEVQVPIYGSPLPLSMIGAKFDENKMSNQRSYFRSVEKRKPIRIDQFEVEWMHVTHSIVDCSSLAITTKAGTIIHTGDFKIDHTPIDNYPTDLHRYAYYGERGVLALLSDSTNSHGSGFTRTEKTVGPTLANLIKNAKGRVFMSTFSSNLHRLVQGMDIAIEQGRKICLIGRSIEKNTNLALDLGYVKYDKKHFVDAQSLDKFLDKDIFVITTGSQGERMSALYRIAIQEHRHIKIKPTDLVILSSKPIPGNEGSVSKLLNELMKAETKVATHSSYPDIHVSGHASQEEQKLMIRLCKPKYFMPIHGEYNHVLKHAQTGIDCGIEKRNIHTLHAGDQIEITPSSLKKIKTVRSGKVFVDNQKNRRIPHKVVYDRQRMSVEGAIFCIARVDFDKVAFIDKVRIQTNGLTDNKQEENMIKDTLVLLNTCLDSAKPATLKNPLTFQEEFKKVFKRYCGRKFNKFPLINVVILDN